MILKMILTLVYTFLITFSVSMADSLEYVLLPVDPGDNQITVYLEVQTYDLTTTGSVNLNIYIGSRQLSETFSKIADIKYDFQLTASEVPIYGRLMNNSIHVELSGINLINAVTLKARFNDMAALSVYPTISLGTAHKVITYCQILGSCHFGFAGLKDVSTIVTVVLPNNVESITLELNDKVKLVDTQISVELSGRQSMLLECVGCDFTNTFINSTGPVAVFAGGKSTVVRKGIKESTFLTQMPLMTSWGKQFILVNSALDDAGDIIRIISRFNKTDVSIEGSPTVQIRYNNGQWIQRLIHKGGVQLITSTKPIMICQIIYNGLNHIAMINVPPTEQFLPHPFTVPCQNSIVLIHHGNSLRSLEITGMETMSFDIVSKSVFMVRYLTRNGSNSECHIMNDGNSFGMMYTADPGQSYLDQLYISGYKLKEITSIKPMVPGDLVDNDGDGEIDEDDCSTLKHSLYYNAAAHSFNDSKNLCENQGMVLAILDNKERYDAALEYLKMETQSNESERKYVWIDGKLAANIPWSVNVTESPDNETKCVALIFKDDMFGSFIKYDCEATTSYLCTGWAMLEDKDCKTTISESKDHKGVLFLFPVWCLSADRGKVNMSITVTSSVSVVLSHFSQGRLASFFDTTGSYSKSHQVEVGYPNAMTVIKVESSTGEFSLHMLLQQDIDGVQKSVSTIAYPYDVWGLHYYAASYCTSNCTSFCLITSAYYDTKITVVFKDTNTTVDVSLMYSQFRVENKYTVDITLDKFQYAMLKSKQDLTGTYIMGDNPISVICGSDFDDYTIGEQLIPISLFSKKKFSNVFQLYSIEKTNMEYIIRVMTSQSNTSCTIQDTVLQFDWMERMDKSGDFFELKIANSAVLHHIECDHEALVWNIVIHNNESGTMTLLPTMSQYYTTQSWYTPVVSTDVVQKLYAHKTKTTEPLKYGNNAKWLLTKGYVTDLTEETKYTTTTENKGIFFFLWNIGHEHGYAFGTHIAMTFDDQVICVLDSSEDEDCDGQVDEERCTLISYNFLPDKYFLAVGKYLPDYDFDGNYDEDCSYTIPDCYAPAINFTEVNDYSATSDTYVTSVFRSFKCINGYTIINSTSDIICYADGKWKPDTICAKDCEDPTTIYTESVIDENGPWNIGSSVTMSCNSGFTLVGSDIIICTNNSMWTSDEFVCVADCNNPSSMVGHSKIVNSTFPVLETYIMICKSGYSVNGNPRMMCLVNSTWSQPEFTCVPDCTNPSSMVDHSTIVNSAFPVLETYIMICNSGYSVNGNPRMMCLVDSTWSQPEFTCVPGCSDPREDIPYSVILNYVEGTPFTPDTTIEVVCNGSMTQIGDSQMTCQSDSSWNNAIRCIPDCSDPRQDIQIDNSVLRYFKENSSKAYNSTYTFRCNLKYKMIGNGVIVCQENSTWSQPSFYCKPCKCLCRNIGKPRYTEVTPDVINQIQQEISKELSVKKETLSSLIRTKISAPSKTQVSKSIGYIGIIMLSMTLGVLVILDIPILIRHFKHFVITVKNLCMRFRK